MIYYASGQDLVGLSDMDEEYQLVPQPAGIYMGHVNVLLRHVVLFCTTLFPFFFVSFLA